MPTLSFATRLRAVAPPDGTRVQGESVRAALEAVFASHPMLRGYVLDDQGALRKHVAIFVDGIRLQGTEALRAPTREASEIHVLQALSGG
ncbi:MAG: MoaD/ThiS family protein [Alphaproteobacteria bacterium]|nr:MoaD/ThiS family protein [Alphaproteobacteria bacterium]